MKISVIIPKSREGDLTKEWCLRQLNGIDHEVIVAKSWQDGLKKTTGEFVTFVEKDCVLSPNYFITLLAVFSERPSFRKLAMVAPSLGVNSWKNKVYGYRLKSNIAMPIKQTNSNEPHFSQIVYLPGTLIRRSALGSLVPNDKDVMLDSFNFSLYFWGNGNMVILHPAVTYVSTDEELDLNYHIDEPGDYDAITKMFRREMIGREGSE
jgi:hypothetical protein